MEDRFFRFKNFQSPANPLSRRDDQLRIVCFSEIGSQDFPFQNYSINFRDIQLSQAPVGPIVLKNYRILSRHTVNHYIEFDHNLVGIAPQSAVAVSYTHLTLPTIYSV